jgi:hypothetical protein
MALTPKQERFAQLVAEGKTQADAYRGAFDVGVNTKAETIQKRASELMSSGEVSGRVDELRKPIIEAVGITLESHLKDLMTLRNLAVKNNQINAAITAEIARGKAAGVSTDRVEATIKTGYTFVVERAARED